MNALGSGTALLPVALRNLASNAIALHRWPCDTISSRSEMLLIAKASTPRLLSSVSKLCQRYLRKPSALLRCRPWHGAQPSQ